MSPSEPLELATSTAWLDATRHLILPAIVLSAEGIALTVRMTRSAMLENLSQDFVRTLRAAGLSERRIYFMNLPPQCTIRIYTVTGDLVQTLTHDSTVDDGQEPWNLVSRDGMDVAFGIYLFHVDAPGVGTSVGRFALIK